MSLRREKELRCFCRSTPLLATYGIDKAGAPYVHLKVYKGDRIYGEMVVKGGEVKMKCRNCLRWHRVNITGRAVQLLEDSPPESEAVTG
jgi:hypothetical protein